MPRIVRVFTALSLLSLEAGAETREPAPRVALLTPPPAHREVAERLASELSSEGYGVEWSSSTSSPCDSPSYFDSEPGVERVWIRLEPTAPETPVTHAFVCYRGAAGRLLGASAHAPSAEPATLALSTIETLNGLRSSAEVPAQSPKPVASKAPAAPRVTSSLSAGGTFAFSPFDLAPLLGASATLRSGVGDYFSLVYDGFVTLRPAELDGVDRRIDAAAAWMRIGPSLSFSLSMLTVDGSLLAGPAFFWATADTEPPLVGTTDFTGAGVITLALGVEVPRSSAFFLRVGALGSVLLPRVTIETGSENVPAWMFLETSLRIGVRWPQAPDGG
jgi:hypothetical protein